MDTKSSIFNSGRKLFAENGYKDTNISQIAEKAGIGVGTFYNYYPSKDELFVEVYIRENEELKRRITESIDMNDDPVTLVTTLLTKNITEMNNNTILKEWYNRELFKKLEDSFYKFGGFKSIEEMMYSGMVELIRKWKMEGVIRTDIEDDMIIAIFNSIPYIDIHKDDIGLKYFPKILFYITDFIIKGLSVK